MANEKRRMEKEGNAKERENKIKMDECSDASLDYPGLCIRFYDSRFHLESVCISVMALPFRSNMVWEIETVFE
jgi:hypothetical protein